jgi:hypothetical protein
MARPARATATTKAFILNSGEAARRKGCDE